MNIRRITFGLFCWSLITVGCSIDEPTNTPTLSPTEEYIRLTLSNSCNQTTTIGDDNTSRIVWNDDTGSGKLILEWESVDINSERTNELSLIISDGEKPIIGRSTPLDSETYTECSYSGLSVTPAPDDAHYANFSTVYYYNTEDLNSAAYCYAVAGHAQITEDSINNQHLCHLQMPSTFTQVASQEPDFLRDYMYMYAATAYNSHQTSLPFNHIPATFRFIVSNTTAKALTLQEISVSVLESHTANPTTKIASNSVDIAFNWLNGNTTLLFSKDGHDKISVTTGDNSVLESNEKYIAYSMVLPLDDNNAFKDKILNFDIKIDNTERVAFQLDAQKLAEANDSNVYNWISGNSYTFRIDINDNGNAEGRILAENSIEVTSSVSDTYTLMYESAYGQRLDNFAPICTLTVEQLAYYEDFIYANAAPRDAKHIGIYDSKGSRQGTIHLSYLSTYPKEKPLYSFGILSDIHIGRTNIDAETDFTNALNFFNKAGTDIVCICGDITQNGTETELTTYQELANQSNIPVYTTSGNHDCPPTGLDTTLWSKYTGLPLVFELPVERNGNIDHFLFFGMTLWNFGGAYPDEHITWLRERLEAYKDDRCFVITHLFFPDRAGNMNYVYPSGNWLRGWQLESIQGMCDSYINSIWFSGHSHWEWSLQKYQDRANIYRRYDGNIPTSGWCVHIPSCGVPISSNGSTRVDNHHGSEGAIVEVYRDCIDILGVDLKNGLYLPIATYRLDTKSK